MFRHTHLEAFNTMEKIFGLNTLTSRRIRENQPLLVSVVGLGASDGYLMKIFLTQTILFACLEVRDIRNMLQIDWQELSLHSVFALDLQSAKCLYKTGCQWFLTGWSTGKN